MPASAHARLSRAPPRCASSTARAILWRSSREILLQLLDPPTIGPRLLRRRPRFLGLRQRSDRALSPLREVRGENPFLAAPDAARRPSPQSRSPPQAAHPPATVPMLPLTLRSPGTPGETSALSGSNSRATARSLNSLLYRATVVPQCPHGYRGVEATTTVTQGA